MLHRAGGRDVAPARYVLSDLHAGGKRGGKKKKLNPKPYTNPEP